MAITTLNPLSLAIGGGAAAPSGAAGCEFPQLFDLKPVYETLPVPVKLSLEALSPEITSKVSFSPLEVYKERISWLDPDQKTVLLPSDEGLLHLASFYGQKYGITLIVTGSCLKLKEAILGTDIDPSITSWGIIATRGDVAKPHVTPLVCSRQPDGTIQIAELDSVRDPIQHVHDAIAELQVVGVNIDLFQTRLPRQADPYSCRTDAIVILKDALRDLSTHNIVDIRSFLGVYDTEEARNCFDLPVSWSKGVQLSMTIKGDQSRPVVNKKHEPLVSFRERFTKMIPCEETYLFTARSEEGALKEERVIHANSKSVNTYLNIKGKKLVDKITDSLASLDGFQQMQFEILKSKYI